MILVFTLKFTLLLVPFAFAGVSWPNYPQVGKELQSELLQLENANAQFNYHVGIDWLVAFVALTGSILALVVSDRIVHKLKNKNAKLDWRDEFK
jgi:hypothetical protein